MQLHSAPLSANVFGALISPPVAHRDYLGEHGPSDDTDGQKTTYHYKLFRVRRSNGKVTTVSLNPALVATACKHMGIDVVQTTVRSAAAEYVDGTPGGCSKWCATQLLDSLRALEANQASVTPVAEPA